MRTFSAHLISHLPYCRCVSYCVFCSVYRKQYRLIWTELPFEWCEVLLKELLGLSNDLLFRAQWLWPDLEGPHERTATCGSLARQGALVEGETKVVGRVTLYIPKQLYMKYNSHSNFSTNKAYREWTSYQIRKIAGCACAGNAGNVFPATDFKGNR